MMSTKIMASILVLFIASIMCLVFIEGAQTQEPIQLEVKPMSIPSADSSTKKVVDSTKNIRNEFVAQKETIRDKVNFLQEQQRQIKETQRQIDIITLK